MSYKPIAMKHIYKGVINILNRVYGTKQKRKEKGLLEEFKRGMLSFDAILQEWKTDPGDIKDHYYKIFSAVKDFDKHIARRYDGMRGSDYELVIIGQLMDELYDLSEIDVFSPEVKNAMLGMIKWRKEL